MSLSNTQYDAIMRVYNQRQFQNKYDQDRRVKEVYDRLPQIRQKRHLEDLKEQKAVLLEACGFGAGYMDMRYHCPDCQDTGYIQGRKCRCFKKEEISLLYSQSNIQEVLERENFS